MSRRDAKAAVAAQTGATPSDFTARPAGGGAWWVSERDFTKMPIDDCVWAVLPSGRVVRAVPPGLPWRPPDDLAELDEESH